MSFHAVHPARYALNPYELRYGLKRPGLVRTAPGYPAAIEREKTMKHCGKFLGWNARERFPRPCGWRSGPCRFARRPYGADRGHERKNIPTLISFCDAGSSDRGHYQHTHYDPGD